MNAQEHEINRDLQQLDDARRLGLITIAEYRQRRRQVLARLGGPAPSAPPVAPRFGARLWTVAGLLALAVLFWLLSR